MQNKNLQDKISILINTCDSYSDLGDVFFTLLNKYGPNCNLTIFINTETKKYKFPGLNIITINAKSKKGQYGKRLRECVKHIPTEYVLPILDDFFIRKPVNINYISHLIELMDNNRDVSCCYSAQEGMGIGLNYARINDGELEKGLIRIPAGTQYTFTTHAGIWRTKDYLSAGRNSVNPWEGEVFSNIKTYRENQNKYYYLDNKNDCFVDYGWEFPAFSIKQGKGVEHNIKDFLNKENIKVDYSQRGFYDLEKAENVIFKIFTLRQNISLIYRCAGLNETILYFAFMLWTTIKHIKYTNVNFTNFLHQYLDANVFIEGRKQKIRHKLFKKGLLIKRDA